MTIIIQIFTTYLFIGLNMFLVLRLLVNFGISLSSKLYTNLVIHL